jgi:hypothetical protein
MQAGRRTGVMAGFAALICHRLVVGIENSKL